MHLVAVLQHYCTPACGATARHYRLLERWAGRFEVTVVTSSAWRAGRQAAHVPDAPPGVRLVEVDVPYANAMGAGRRARAFAFFAAKALRTLRRLPRPDLLFGTTTPLSVPAVTALAARRLGVPWAMEVRDLWPAFPIQMGAVSNRGFQRGLTWLEHALYRNADHVVTLSPDMTAHVERIVQGRTPVTTTYNGTDLPQALAARADDPGRLRRQYGLGEGPVVLYAGTLGRANNAPLLEHVAQHLARERPDASLVVLGDGFARTALDAAARSVPTLRVLGPQPRIEVFAWFALADVSLVSFNDLPVLGTNSPAKLFDTLACGTPPVVVNDGWMRRLVESEGVGAYAPAGAPDAVAEAVEQLLADDARRTAMRARAEALVDRRPDMFDRRVIADRYADVFDALLGQSSAEKPAGARLYTLPASAA